jgi:MCP family monocarboxylic acid transporter-like MFS transporter 14
VGLGWAGDKPWMPVAKTYGVCLIVSGISTLAMPLLVQAHSYFGLSTIAALFGLSLASNYSFTPLLVLQIVSLERFTPAFGVVLLVQGVGNLIGPPLAGNF